VLRKHIYLNASFPLNRCIARFHVVSKADELGFPTLSYLKNHVVRGDYMLCSHLGRVFSPNLRVTCLTCENAVRLRATDYMVGNGDKEVGLSPTQE